MKKLENISLEKFKVSVEQSSNLRGGKMANDSIDNSYTYSWTSTGPNTESKLDGEVTDICLDW